MTIILNKKEYHDTTIVKVHHEEYFNLNIYPKAGILEREAGLLSELAEMFLGDCTFELLGASQFLVDNLPKCSGTNIITYLNGIGEFNGSFVLGQQDKSLDAMYKYTIHIHDFEKVLYCNEIDKFI